MQQNTTHQKTTCQEIQMTIQTKASSMKYNTFTMKEDQGEHQQALE